MSNKNVDNQMTSNKLAVKEGKSRPELFVEGLHDCIIVIKLMYRETFNPY